MRRQAVTSLICGMNKKTIPQADLDHRPDLTLVDRRVYNELVYDGYKIYGPYGQQRKMIALVSPEHRTTMSYARYLMSLHIGRELTEQEEVDHIDDDCTNDVIENLQILTPVQNREKRDQRMREKASVTLICPECSKEFTRLRRNTNLRFKDKRASSPSCCSRSCSGSYHSKRRWRRGVDQFGRSPSS